MSELKKRELRIFLSCRQAARVRRGESREDLNSCDNKQQGKTCEAVRAGKKF